VASGWWKRGYAKLKCFFHRESQRKGPIPGRECFERTEKIFEEEGTEMVQAPRISKKIEGKK